MKASQSPARSGIKRYNLALPEGLYEEIEKIANTKQTTVLDVLKRFIKLGLLIEASPNASFFVKEDDNERQIILL